MSSTKLKTIDEAFVYSRIGMALVSVQRVEYVAKALVEILIESNTEFKILLTEEFSDQSPNIDKLSKYTLGNIFRLLKLNPKLSNEHEFDEFRDLRNSFVHSYWVDHLQTKSEQQKKEAIDFCFKVGRYAEKMESFFKGLAYLISLRYVKDKDHLSPELKEWENDFYSFMNSVVNKHSKS